MGNYRTGFAGRDLNRQFRNDEMVNIFFEIFLGTFSYRDKYDKIS
jgi:hypothetical protein